MDFFSFSSTSSALTINFGLCCVFCRSIADSFLASDFSPSSSSSSPSIFARSISGSFAGSFLGAFSGTFLGRFSGEFPGSNLSLDIDRLGRTCDKSNSMEGDLEGLGESIGGRLTKNKRDLAGAVKKIPVPEAGIRFISFWFFEKTAKKKFCFFSPLRVFYIFG